MAVGVYVPLLFEKNHLASYKTNLYEGVMTVACYARFNLSVLEIPVKLRVIEEQEKKGFKFHFHYQYMYDLLKKEQIYNLCIYYKSWLVICRQKINRIKPY